MMSWMEFFTTGKASSWKLLPLLLCMGLCMRHPWGEAARLAGGVASPSQGLQGGALGFSRGVFFDKWVITTRSFNPDCQPGADRPTPMVNGRLPGPLIQVPEGTRVVVQVTNQQKYPLTIHWHGVPQNGSQWYDGVPGVTQCHLLPGITYTYNFSTWGHPGTLWWHAHASYLRNSVFGGLFIEPHPSTLSPQSAALRQVAATHSLFLSDWYHDSPEDLATNSPGWLTPDAVLINGASFFPSAPSCNRGRVFSLAVDHNRWYRIRVVNSALFAAFNFALQGHTLYTLESEGGVLKREPFNSYTILSGQSYSFLFLANQTPGVYWIRSQPLYDAEGPSPGLAFIRYQQAPTARVPALSGFASGTNSMADQVTRTVAASAPPAWVKKVDRLVMLEMNSDVDTGFFSVNNVTLQHPSTPPLYLARKGLYARISPARAPDIPPKGLWNYSGPSRRAFNMVEVPHGAVVQLVIQNGRDIAMNPHPFHLHGFNFFLVGWGRGHFNPEQWESYRYNLENPVFRNTAALDEASWIAMRFKADNPGIWLLHCHLEPHAEGGMLALFHVAQDSSIPPVPADYPSCSGRRLE